MLPKLWSCTEKRKKKVIYVLKLSSSGVIKMVLMSIETIGKVWGYTEKLRMQGTRKQLTILGGVIKMVLVWIKTLEKRRNRLEKRQMQGTRKAKLTCASWHVRLSMPFRLELSNGQLPRRVSEVAQA